MEIIPLEETDDMWDDEEDEEWVGEEDEDDDDDISKYKGIGWDDL
jgi:hypothetical protein